MKTHPHWQPCARVKKKLAIAFVLLSSLGQWPSAYAQEEPSSTHRYALTAAYFGETITHPGATVGLEKYLLRSRRYKLFVGANLGGYVHHRNHKALFANLQLGQRITFRSGWFLDQSVGVGYLRTFLDGEVYAVDSDGSVEQVANTGRPHFMPSVSVGVGYDFTKKGLANLQLFLRPQVFWQMPFNNYSLLHIGLQAGLIVPFGK